MESVSDGLFNKAQGLKKRLKSRQTLKAIEGLYKEAAKGFHEEGRWAEEAACWDELGDAYDTFKPTEYGKASVAFKKAALKFSRIKGREREQGICWKFLGLNLACLGKHLKAEWAFSRSLRVLRHVPDTGDHQADCWRYIGAARTYRSKPKGVIQAYRKSLRLLQQVGGDGEDKADCWNGIASALEYDSNYVKAAKAWRKAEMATSEERDDKAPRNATLEGERVMRQEPEMKEGQKNDNSFPFSRKETALMRRFHALLRKYDPGLLLGAREGWPAVEESGGGRKSGGPNVPALTLKEARDSARKLADEALKFAQDNAGSALDRMVAMAGPFPRRHDIMAILAAMCRLMLEKGRDRERLLSLVGLYQKNRVMAARFQLDQGKGFLGRFLDRDLDPKPAFWHTFYLADDGPAKVPSQEWGKRTAISIKAALDDEVIGQEQAKEALSLAAWKHLQRASGNGDVTRSVLLLVGPTGSGKTLLCRTLSEDLEVPFAEFTATQLSENAYVGASVEDILGRLYNAAGNDQEAAEKGIVFLDEFDKLRTANLLNSSGGSERDVKGRGVQQELLTVIEGSKVQCAIRSNRFDSVPKEMDTQNMMFVLGGAFDGLKKIRDRRLRRGGGECAIGFGGESPRKKNMDPGYTPEDLIEYGIIPELAGRISRVVELELLTLEAMTEILWRKGDGLMRPYLRLFARHGVRLEFGTAFLAAVAKKAVDRGTGARGLSALLEEVLNPWLYRVLCKKKGGFKSLFLGPEMVEARNIPKEGGKDEEGKREPRTPALAPGRRVDTRMPELA